MSAHVTRFHDFQSLLKTTNGHTMRVYVDTNVVLDFWDHKRAKGNPGATHLRCNDVEQFFTTSRSAQVQLVLSPLVVEEVFHCLRRAHLEELAERYHCGNEKLLRRDFPEAYATGVQNARHEVRKVLSYARQHGAVSLFPVRSGTERRWGSVVEKMFLHTIETCEGLNAMDALHLVFSVLLRCTHFASSDGGFKDVSGLLLLSR